MKRFFLIQWHKLWYLHHQEKWAQNLYNEHGILIKGKESNHFEKGWNHGLEWKKLDEKGFHAFAKARCLKVFGYDIDAPQA